MVAEILLAWSFLIAPIYGLGAQTKSVSLESIDLMESDSVDDYFPTDRPRLELMPWSSEIESQPVAPTKPPRTFIYEKSTRSPIDTKQRVVVHEREEPTKKQRIVKTIKLKAKLIANKIKGSMKKMKKYFSMGFKATKQKLKKLRHW